MRRWATALVFGPGLACSAPAPPAARPNVLLVTLDTVRADHLGAYGHAAAATPRLDALARRGVRFESAIAATPLTAPSHASMLSGRIPPRHGVRDNGSFVLPAAVPSLAEAFSSAGYRTGAFVSGFPLDRRFGFARGFGVYDDRLPHGHDPRRAPYVERRGEATTTQAITFVAAVDPRPWFAWVHYFDPHAPYEAPPPYAQRFASSPYDGEIAYVDEQLGRLLDAASDSPVVVLVVADHGESLGEHGEATHGFFVYDATLRVPFIVAGPGVGSGIVSSVLARGIDVAPTLLDLAGLPGLPAADGRSLRAAANGATLPDAPAYAESLFAQRNLGWAPLYAWRTTGHKLIEAPEVELYDVKADPAETRNLAATASHTVAELRRPLRAASAAPGPSQATTAPAETSERLRALGYLGGGQPVGTGSGRDPKAALPLLQHLERGLAEARVDPSRAVAELSAVLAADPKVALALRHRAIAWQAAGRWSEALRDLDSLEALAEASLEDQMLRAETLRLSGRAEAALKVVAAAADRFPEAPDPELFRGRILRGLGRRDEAAAAYEAALRRVPDHVESLRGLADLALDSGALATAGARYQEILAADPNDAGALTRLGVVRARENRASEAVPLLQKAAVLAPGNPEALLALAGALAKTGRAAEAVPLFERALAAGGETPLALNGLGLARLEAGDRAGGVAALRRSLQLDPRQASVSRLLQDLGAR